jgi:hypothetical protein
MAIIGNIQLRLANEIAKDTEDAWRGHRRDCPRCATAQRERKLENMCRAGGSLYDDRKAAAADLARERRLAKLPIPGQEVLFQ